MSIPSPGVRYRESTQPRPQRLGRVSVVTQTISPSRTVARASPCLQLPPGSYPTTVPVIGMAPNGSGGSTSLAPMSWASSGMLECSLIGLVKCDVPASTNRQANPPGAEGLAGGPRGVYSVAHRPLDRSLTPPPQVCEHLLGRADSRTEGIKQASAIRGGNRGLRVRLRAMWPGRSRPNARTAATHSALGKPTTRFGERSAERWGSKGGAASPCQPKRSTLRGLALDAQQCHEPALARPTDRVSTARRLAAGTGFREQRSPSSRCRRLWGQRRGPWRSAMTITWSARAGHVGLLACAGSPGGLGGRLRHWPAAHEPPGASRQASA